MKGRGGGEGRREGEEGRGGEKGRREGEEGREGGEGRRGGRVGPLLLSYVPAIFTYRPMGDPGGPLKMLLYDSVYDQYRGVICIMAIADGKLAKGVYVCSSGGGLEEDRSGKSRPKYLWC